MKLPDSANHDFFTNPNHQRVARGLLTPLDGTQLSNARALLRPPGHFLSKRTNTKDVLRRQRRSASWQTGGG